MSRFSRVAFISAVWLLAGTACDSNSSQSQRSGDDAAGVEIEQVTPEALRAAVTDERVQRFYQGRGWQPIWTAEKASQLTAAIQEAQRHALDPRSFLTPARPDATPATREAALTLAAINYAEALGRGVVDPRRLWDVYTVPRNRVDAVAGLSGAVQADRIGEWLASLPPNDEEYRALAAAYGQYRQRAAQERDVAIPDGGAISSGDRDPRVPQIVAALRRDGYLPAATAAPAGPAPAPKSKNAPAPAPPAQNVYTPEIMAAVRRLQAERGLTANGVVGPDTIDALNFGAAERMRALAVNLERRRWLERQAATTRIDVNTAGAFLEYWRNGARAHQARVVVGQPGWETPQLGTPLTRLVANPPWTVPESIAEAEILPRGSSYMARNNMRVQNGRIVQAPGPESALGLVKFDLDNPHAIYLHDTPAKALFATDDRHASHGCARVEDALGFARMIAQNDGKLSAFDQALATQDETPVNLSFRIPVRFLYHTAYVDGGRVVFRTDPYRWDDRVAEAMGMEARRRRAIQGRNSDVGP